jgi:hypothetical protein
VAFGELSVGIIILEHVSYLEKKVIPGGGCVAFFFFFYAHGLHCIVSRTRMHFHGDIDYGSDLNTG